jgi:hypothetical protein
VNGETRLGLVVLAVFFVLTLVLCIAGVLRLIGPGLALKKKAEALRDHPVLRAGPLAEIYIARLNERSAELAVTLERLQLALGELDRATHGLRTTLGTIANVFVSLRTGFRGLRGNLNGRR